MKPYNIFNKSINRFKLSKSDSKELWNIICPICCNKEFLKRCDEPFYHHDTISLGEHIINDTIVTFQLCKNKKKANIKLACIIAMFHDLYEKPWQNARDHKKLMNKHGFVHPIEAAINAITWYSEYFKDNKETEIIVDGIIHHMYPLPVRAMNLEIWDLNNLDKFKKLDKKYQEIISNSTKRWSIRKIGFCRSKYLEGRIVSKADKKVALSLDLKRPGAYLSLINGNNKKIVKKQ